jgi:hypothetical protein
VTNHDVDVTANGGEYRCSDQRQIADPKMLTSRRQDHHLIDTDKLNVSLIYKWIILYFISLNFYCFLKISLLDLKKYSKTKIGNNFLPGLVSGNLNADLNVSVLGKKV